MREVDRIAIEELGLDVLQLMEYAGLNVARFAIHVLGQRVFEGGVTVLAGGGNNGGDGLVAARHLANWGVRVTVIAAQPASQEPSAAAQQRRILVHSKIPLLALAAGHALTQARGAIQDSALVVDALLGFGAGGNPRSPMDDLIRMVNAFRKPIIAVDLPSGLDATTGVPGDPCIQATWTLTLGLPKTGLFASRARPVVGELFVADIGVPPWVYTRWGIDGPVFSSAPWLPVPAHAETR